MKNYYLILIALLILIIACGDDSNDVVKQPDPIIDIDAPHDRDKVDSLLIVETVYELSSNAYEGRRVGTSGGTKSQTYISDIFTTLGLLPFGNSYEQPFSVALNSGVVQAKNIIGYIEGSKHPDSYIAISAHFDHLGIGSNGEIYNGAGDNASGVGGLVGIAKYFTQNPPEHSIIFLALDAEEVGFKGAYYFVNNPTIPLKNISYLLNLDMICRSYKKEIYASGTYHFPFLKPRAEKVNEANPHVKVKFGHDVPASFNTGVQDWTYSSDHTAFFQYGIPYIYFGVEDYREYHREDDEFRKINREFYLDVVDLLIDMTEELDQN